MREIENQQSSSEQAVQISIKKPQSGIREKKKIVKQKVQRKKTISPSIKKLLSQQIQNKKLLAQLQKRPVNLGPKQSQIIKISDPTQKSRTLSESGVQLVHVLKKDRRVGIDRRQQLLKGFSHLRKDPANLKLIKRK